MTEAPQVSPAPKAAINTTSPSLIFPSRTASSSAIGIEAEEVRVRLPEVEVELVIRRSPAAVGAVSGAAANGYIVARTRAALSADTPGKIVELNVQEGQAI